MPKYNQLQGEFCSLGRRIADRVLKKLPGAHPSITVWEEVVEAVNLELRKEHHDQRKDVADGYVRAHRPA